MGLKLKVAVVGAAGYAGFELTRILLNHPRVATPLLLKREGGATGLNLADTYPQLAHFGVVPVEPFSWDNLQTSGTDLLFLATPHEVSREWVPEAINRGLRVIDLSGAWRLKNPANSKVYGFTDVDPDRAEVLTNKAVYGIPELRGKCIADAQLVANPGCYATSVILALAPLLPTGLVALEHGIVCDCKSGVSGAGRQPTLKTHFVEVADNLSAYSVFGHRHTGEILEQLKLDAEQIVFTPHLLPIPRGILSSIYLRLRKAVQAPEIESCIRTFYAGYHWVRVFPNPHLPQIQSSTRTNFCDIGFNLSPDGKRLVLVSCLDNLIKGAAGQAVQNMNVMYGWGEQEGLN